MGTIMRRRHSTVQRGSGLRLPGAPRVRGRGGPPSQRYRSAVVVVRSSRGGRLLRAEADYLLTAVEPDRVVHDHVRHIEAGPTVEDVRLVVVRERMKDVV